MIPRRLAGDVQRAAAFRAAVRQFLRRTEEITNDHGLTPLRYHLLLAIAAAPREESTVTELCERLQLPQPAVTQLVQRAVAARLVERRRSDTDRRVGVLSLTPEGEERLLAVLTALRADRELVQAQIRSLDRAYRAVVKAPARR
jgi:DNA-binding MarR family transcriptional regulator